MLFLFLFIVFAFSLSLFVRDSYLVFLTVVQEGLFPTPLCLHFRGLLAGWHASKLLFGVTPPVTGRPFFLFGGSPMQPRPNKRPFVHFSRRSCFRPSSLSHSTHTYTQVSDSLSLSPVLRSTTHRRAAKFADPYCQGT